MLSRRVLIIEDDADAAGVLEAYLRRENYDVVITGDGLSGLDMAHRWKPDLILLDVMLPGLNGTEVLAGLRRKNDVPVIMVTAIPGHDPFYCGDGVEICQATGAAVQPVA